MAIQVKVHQDTRSNGNGLFYGRAKHFETVNREELAKRIQANCTVKHSDVLAVLTELTEVMTYELAHGNKILLDDFGYFYISVRTSGAMTAKEWNVQDNVKGFRCNFLPVGKRDKSGLTSRTFTAGLKAVKMDVEEKKKP